MRNANPYPLIKGEILTVSSGRYLTELSELITEVIKEFDWRYMGIRM